mmetsp:Transcript_40133/g.125656  ORF Transcript_40133/g.125656 Transcript_40133/m.125656 type:complete len:200 (-) Transcript_40133:2120-2719(-)
MPSRAKRASGATLGGSRSCRSVCSCRSSSMARRKRRTRSPSSSTHARCRSIQSQPLAQASAAPANAPSSSGSKPFATTPARCCRSATSSRSGCSASSAACRRADCGGASLGSSGSSSRKRSKPSSLTLTAGSLTPKAGFLRKRSASPGLVRSAAQMPASAGGSSCSKMGRISGAVSADASQSSFGAAMVPTSTPKGVGL